MVLDKLILAVIERSQNTQGIKVWYIMWMAMCVQYLPWEKWHQDSQRTAAKGCVMLWAILSWKTLNPAIHVNVTLSNPPPHC